MWFQKPWSILNHFVTENVSLDMLILDVVGKYWMIYIFSITIVIEDETTEYSIHFSIDALLMDSKLSMNFTNLKFCDVKTSDIDETCSYIAQQEYSRVLVSPCGCRTTCSESLYEVCWVVTVFYVH